GSAGRPAGEARIRILDESGGGLPPGPGGLLYARQPAFPGLIFNNKPEARRGIERDRLLSPRGIGLPHAAGYPNWRSTLLTPLPLHDALPISGSAGRPAGEARIRILDESGGELPRGQVGLIYARQPAFPDFIYNNNPEARRDIERDGLISLGDMGFLDEEGY